MADMTKTELDHARRQAVALYQAERAANAQLRAEVASLRAVLRCPQSAAEMRAQTAAQKEQTP